LHFEGRLRAALEHARSRGRVTTVDAGDYHPERGRFAADQLQAVFTIFESDSELCVRLSLGDTLDRITQFVRAADALARGLGIDLAARQTLARDRRDAAERSSGLDDDARREANTAFRAVGRDLRRDLSGEPAGDFLAHLDRVSVATTSLAPAALPRLVPTLLHHSAVRFLGPNPDAERLGYTFWQRTLDGLGRR
jgi:thiopeptide-type bacteriocin biosynthesis protein